MRRVGNFTGKIYDADYDFAHCPECCTMISEDQLSNEGFLQNLRQNNILKCLSCAGCPAARNQGLSMPGEPRIAFEV